MLREFVGVDWRAIKQHATVPVAVILLGICGYVIVADGHGILYDPPGRASMWRFGFNVPVNENDTGLNCGGREVRFVPLSFLLYLIMAYPSRFHNFWTFF